MLHDLDKKWHLFKFCLTQWLDAIHHFCLIAQIPTSTSLHIRIYICLIEVVLSQGYPVAKSAKKRLA